MADLEENYDLPELDAGGAASDADDVEAALEAALGEKDGEDKAVEVPAVEQSRPAHEPSPGAVPVAPEQPRAAEQAGKDLLNSTGSLDISKLSKEQRTNLSSQVISILSESELDRYEAFRRSSLKKPLQRVMHVVTGVNPKPQDKALISVASVAKSFVGQLIETARTLASEQGHDGPLEPTHIHAAYQILLLQGRVEGQQKRRRLL